MPDKSVKEDKPNKNSSEDLMAICYINKLPFELILLIVSHLDIKDILKCRLVSQHLCNIISNVDFWHHNIKKLLMFESPMNVVRLLEATQKWDWKQFAVICNKKVFGRNLLQNGSGERHDAHADKEHGSGGRDKLKKIPDWVVLHNGGDGWQVERPPYGSDPVNDLPNVVGGGCFTTSHGSCVKQQTVDLWKHVGISDFLDHVQPTITVSEWVAGRFDCESRYKVEVKLIRSDKKAVAAEWTEENILGGRTEWKQVTHRFVGYGEDVRYVVYRHSGQDLQAWSGWYGAKMTGAAVTILPPGE